jgi:hypothetical protein
MKRAICTLGAKLCTAAVILPGVAWGWTGTADSYGFTVDRTSRNDVVSFWQAVYLKSEGYQNRINWTGGSFTSLAAGAEGTISTTFVTDVERRTNYIRAMCGVPASVRFNTGATVNILPTDAYPTPSLPLAATTTKSAASQRSALMILRTTLAGSAEGLSHTPATFALGWTTAAWNANNKGGLAYTFYGPGAIDAYCREDVASGFSSWNFDVGHRRWLLNLQSTNFATGDIPGTRPELNGNVALPSSNCLYCVPKASELDTAVTPRFVPYPAAGFFPAPLNTPYWSLSYPGANFSAATVSMTSSGGTVTTSVISRLNGYGDNSIVWEVPTTVASRTITADTTYNITVSGIGGSGVPTSYSYSVTLINPYVQPGAPSLTGSTTPTVSGSTYSFTRTAASDAMEAGFFRPTTANWVEGAEDSPTPQVVNSTDSNYTFRAAITNYFKTGAKAFRLALPTSYDPVVQGIPQQSFELTREVIPGASGKLNFWYKRFAMSPFTTLYVETSPDGLVWTTRDSFAGVSGAGAEDSAFVNRTNIALPVSSEPIRIRFRYAYSGAYSAQGIPTGGVYTHLLYPTSGIFIDDITVTNCQTLEKKGGIETAPSATSVSFNSTSAGEALSIGQVWWLRLRSKFGGTWYPYGPALVATISERYIPTGSTAPPVAGATYLFSPDGEVSSYDLEVAKISSAAWNEGAETSPTPLVIDGTGAYNLISTFYAAAGTRAFRLALDSTSDILDTVEIDRTVIPISTSNLTFKTRRGKMDTSNTLHAEVSIDGGVTWTSVFNLAGSNIGAINDIFGFTTRTVSLSAYAGKDTRIRFAFKKLLANPTLAASNADSGVWIDDVSVSGGTWLETRAQTSLAASASSFRLNATSAGASLVSGGSYRLRLRNVISGVPSAWGGSLTVVPTSAPALTGFAAWETYDYPMLAGVAFNADSDGDGSPNGVEFAFSLDPLVRQVSSDQPVRDLAAGKLRITRSLPSVRTGITYGAEWADSFPTWSTAGVTVTTTGGQAVASVPIGTGKRFIRWKITKP